MKVIAISASASDDMDNTSRILAAFLGGMSEAGAEIDHYSLEDKTIHPCRMDRSCQGKTPGRCCQTDEMAGLIQAYVTADVLVLASPVWQSGLAGTMKCCLDRMTPLMEPFLESDNDTARQPPRYEVIRRRKFVLVSGSIAWEPESFGPIVAQIRGLTRNLYAEYAGSLLRPHGAALQFLPVHDHRILEVIDAARDAGRSLAREGCISQQVLNQVSTSLLPLEEYVQLFNGHMKNRIDAGQKSEILPGAVRG